MAPQAISSAATRFFAVYSISAGASVAKTLGARLAAASSLVFPYPFSAVGQLPASSGLTIAGVNSAVLISTPSSPAGGVYVNTPKPALTWVGISTIAAAALGAGANYSVQIDNNSDFSSVEVVLSTPVVIGSTSALTASGSIALSTHTLADDTIWYWRVFIQSGELEGPYSLAASFVTDLSLPSVSGFAVKSSTGGWLAESQWIGLSAGVTVQASVQDLEAGLAVSTSALWSGSDGHDWGDLTSGFSVKYTTTAGTNWIEGAGWAASNDGLPAISGETEVRSLAVYGGKLYGGVSSGKVAVFNGTAWSAANGGLAVVSGASQVPSLAVYNGKLYAGTNYDGKAAVYDGTTWSAANGGLALIAGETRVASFAVYNGKLYAGTLPGGKVAVFDGTTWSASNGGSAVAAAGTEVNSLSVYNGRLYAGTAPGGKVAVFDGNVWSAANGASPVVAGATNINSLAVYNGKLYAGTYPGGKAAVFDGATWSAANGGNAVISGVSDVLSLSVYNGKLYAGTTPGGKAAVFDGTTWNAANGGSALIADETSVFSLAAYNGRLYAGTYPGGKVAVMSPLGASLSGSDGTKAAQTLTANGTLALAQSQSSLVCNGSACAAVNQVVLNASDLAGNVRTYGPYAVLVDIAPPPQPSISAYQAYFTSVTASIGAVTDPHSGTQGYNFELSEDSGFSVLTASTGYLSQTSAAFPGLVEATTYYVRASARDNVLNASQPSVYITTMTPAIVNVSTWNAAPSGLMQGTSSVFLIFDLATSAGRSTTLSQVRVAKIGTLADADITSVYIYRDTGDGVYGAADSLAGSAVVVSGTATVNMAPQAINSTATRFFAVYSLSAGASVAKTLGARLAAASSLAFPYPFGAFGQLPATSGLAIAGVNPAVLISTPSNPAGGVYINMPKPALTWVGISTITAAAVGAVANYSVQIDNNSDFSSVEVALSTPVMIGSVSALTANGSLELSTHTLADSTTWYWRVFTQGGGVDGQYSSVASFVTDLSLPSVSGFAVKSSTGGWLAESQWTGLSTGVTVQATVQDLVSGLAVSTSALWGGSDGHGWGDLTSGFSVKYTTNAGTNWTEGAGWAASNGGSPVLAGETEVRSFAVYAGKLYAGTGGGGKVAVFDGNTWSPANGGSAVIGGETQVHSLAVYGGKLYAGTGPGGKVAVFDGSIWSPANGGSAVIAGETAVYSLAVYNGKLYAGTSNGGKVAVFDGTTWSATNGGSAVISGVQFVFSLAVYNGKLYAGTYTGGKVAVFDGNTWNTANGGNPVVAGAAYVQSLAVYNGKLYAGTDSGGKAAVFDGTTWSVANGGSALIAGGNYVQSLAVYNGKLYAGTYPGGKAAVFDGTTWSAANWGNAIVAGESQVHSLAAYNGKLYAGTFSGGKVAELSPLSAALSGEDGTKTAQTLTVNGALNLVQSQNNLVCGGSVCGARNQVVFNASDLAGNVKTYGPYAVLMDTTPPSVSIQSFSVSTFTLTLAASGSDPLSGFKDYHFEVSSAADFGSGISSTAYTAQNSAVFADMSEATTYYARVSARDNVDNVSGYLVAASTLTRGFVYVSSSGAAPVNVLQGADAVMMSLVMVTNPGRSASLSRLVLARTGTAAAADIAAVKIYRDNNADGLVDAGDTLFGTGGFSGANASVSLAPSIPVGEVQTRLLVVYSFVTGAAVEKTAGASLDSAEKMAFSDPYSASGSFPLGSSLSTIQDGVNRLDITAISLAPGSVPPGLANVPMIKLVMNTDVGTSLVDKLNVILAANMTSGNISSVKLYLDVNGNAQFDLLGDQLLSSGSDIFLNYSSTVTLSAPAADRTVGTVTRYMFVVVDVGPDAPEGAKFSVAIPTSTAFTLHNAGDTAAMSPSAFTSDQVTVQTRNTANIYARSLIPAEMVQGELYAVALASVSVNLGIAELNRMIVGRLGNSLDSDIRSVNVYRDQVLDGGDFNQYFDFFLGSGVFTGGLASINIATVTISAGATTQLFVVYEVSPSGMPGNTVGARFTNTSYFRMSSDFTTVYANFPYNTQTGIIRATMNPFKISAAMEMNSGGLFHGATNSAMLRLDVKSEFNPVNWTALRVKKLGTLPDALVDAVKLYRDANGDSQLTPGVDQLVTDGADVFSGGEVNLAFGSQSVSAAGGVYFLTLDIDPDTDVDLGYTAGVEVSTTADFAINSPNYISTASVAAPYRGGPVDIKQYPNIVTVSTANILPSGGAYSGDLDVPVFKLTLKTDISKAKLLEVRFTKTGTLTDAEVKAVKVYYDLNNRGAFDPGNLSAYLLATPSTVTFGTDGQPGSVTLGILPAGRNIAKAGSSYFVVVDLQGSAAVGRSLTMRVSDSSNFTVSAPNSVAPAAFSSPPLYVRATAQSLRVAFENKLSTYVVQGQTSVLVASFTVTASSFSIDLSRIDLARGGNGVDGDITAIRLYRDSGNGVWGGNGIEETLLAEGVFSVGRVSFSPAVQTIEYPVPVLYYIAADISETASNGSTFGVGAPAGGYFGVNEPHAVSSVGLPFYSQLAVIQPTVDTLVVAGIDSGPSIAQGESNKVMGRLRMKADTRSALVSSVRFDKAGSTPDADIVRLRLYRDSNHDLVFGAGDQLAGTLNAFSSGLGVMVVSPSQSVGIGFEDYFVTADISTLAAINTSFSLGVTPAVVAPDVLTITGSSITFTMAGVIADSPDTVSMNFSDIASQSLYVGVADNQLARLSFWTDNDVAYLTGFKLSFAGLAGPSDIPLVKIYRDTDGNGYFDSAADALAATAQITGGNAYLYLPGSGDAVTVSTRAYFAVVDIASGAVINNTVSLGLPNENSLFVAGSDRVAVFPGQATITATIRDPLIPTPPELSIYRADGRVHPKTTEAFTAYRTLLKFRWHSVALLGSVEQAYYFIGPQPANELTPAGSWIACGASAEVSIRGLTLLNNGIYYLSVRVKNSAGAYYSDIVSRRFVVDTVVPTLGSGALSLVTEGSDRIINWSRAEGGASGIEYYVVEERRGNSPTWVALSTTSALYMSVSGSGVTLSEIARSPGAYYYRIYPVNGAGLAGAASEPMAVNIGLEKLAAISDASVYPNPFDSRKRGALIAFTLNTASAVSVTIYDIFGNKVKKLAFTGVAGANSVAWDGTDSSGKKVSKGIYLCVIRAAGDSKVLKAGVIH
ncbi:MAG: FlgD immunoglobulin-like domain containing protein [Elusimicrobiota bacterium]|nr:FlgD immunoglobulin-like domain containing protein [Elusimicrobiota bacterium]